MRQRIEELFPDQGLYMYYDHDNDNANDYDNEIKNHIVPQFDCFYTLWMTLMFIITTIMIMTI